MIPKRGNGERGIVLVAVLCLVSVLTVLALGALQAVRRHDQLAHRSFEILQATELADSAIRVAILTIAAPSAQVMRPQLPNPMTIQVFGQSIPVHIEREARRVDLNVAAESVLATTLTETGMHRIEASALAARIADWRDPDDAASLQGAERAEYRRAGRSSGPRNSAFEVTAELRQVLGAERLTSEALDAFTVYSHVPTALRDDPDIEIVPGALAGEAAQLRACVTLETTATCRKAIVRFTGNRVQPVLVHAWHTEWTQ
jgi:general secretion pathway protein K